MADSTDKATWIWVARQRHTVDAYLRARRTFRLAGKPASARLRVSAFSEYVLYVNGRYVGRGPSPGPASAPAADVYTEADLPLKRGANVLAVLAHNAHVGRPGRPRVSAGLWLQLDVTLADGSALAVGTDGRWKVAPAEDFSRRSPRVYWTAGFAEVRDTRREPSGWAGVRFSDRRWASADEVGGDWPEGGPADGPRDRSGPRPAETFRRPRHIVAAGRVSWPAGVTAVPFEFAVPNPAHGEFYAATFVYAPERRRARLVFDCDEAGVVYVNNRQALRQGYSEEFVHWLGPDEHDEYTGIHRGQGRRALARTVDLDEGWNSLGIVIYDPGTSWGFALRMEDPRTGEPLPVEFSPDCRAGDLAHWHVVREELCPCGNGALPDTPAPNARTFPDPAYQAAWEGRVVRRRTPRGAASLVEGRRAAGPLVLEDGEFIAYDFGGEQVGYVELEAEGPAGAILDLVWAEDLDPAGRPEAVRGPMRQADRLILRGGRQTVRLVNRRALRYLELVARLAGGSAGAPAPALAVHRLGIHSAGQAAGAAAPLETEDLALGGALRLMHATVGACVQDALEGSPGRDAEQSVPAAFFLSQAERLFAGRTAQGEAALRAFAADQKDDGFLRAVVPSGTVHCVPDWSLLWVLWLADHVAWTGDRVLAADLYPAAEKVLEWTARFLGEDGLLVNKPDRRPWWLMLDLSPLDKRGEATAWQALYVRARRAAGGLADALGRDDDAGRHRTEAEAVAGAARDRLWDARRGLFADGRVYDHLSDQASAATNYYALYGGLPTRAQADRILAALWKDGRAEAADWGPRENPYAKYFALVALLERGHVERALAMIRAYWGRMARDGLATVPEVFPLRGPEARADGEEPAEGLHGGAAPWVLCHAWGVHPAALLATHVLGVRPAGPGCDPLLLAPAPGGLVSLRGRLWTPRGRVQASIRREGRRRTVRFVLPEGAAYRLDRSGLGPGDEVEVAGGREPAAGAAREAGGPA